MPLHFEKVETVIDIGAANGRIKEFLPRHVQYIPVDYIPYSSETYPSTPHASTVSGTYRPRKIQSPIYNGYPPQNPYPLIETRFPSGYSSETVICDLTKNEFPTVSSDPTTTCILLVATLPELLSQTHTLLPSEFHLPIQMPLIDIQK